MAKNCIQSESDLHEFIGQVIDIFEDFLEERDISIANDERYEDADAAIIYGSDYGELYDGIEDTLMAWRVIKPKHNEILEGRNGKT